MHSLVQLQTKLNVRGLAVLILCAALTIPAVALAEVGPEWVARYDGPAHGDDEATDVAVDDSGYVYVTGTTGTIKYSPAGDTIWVRHDAGSGSALAVDDSGYVYVTGSAGTVKYSPAGDTIWVGCCDRDSKVLAVDDSGNVYVTGIYGTIKYSPTGNMIWKNRDIRFGGYSRANDLAVDDSGNVYVTGPSDYEFLTIKYSPAGETVWERRYAGGETAWPEALALDGDGNVCVAGWMYWTGGDDIVLEWYAYVTIKYSPAGDVVWVNRYDYGTEAKALAVDSNNNVYVTGGPGYRTIKYSPAGDTIWVRSYADPLGLENSPEDLAVDGYGNVYVTGWGNLWPDESDYGYLTIKYSPAGDTIWVRRYDGPGVKYGENWLREDRARGMAVDKRGNVYVTGLSEGDGTQSDYATIKYSNPTGDLDCDGKITISDVVLLGNIIDGLIDLTGTCGSGQADVDEDGDIDEDDYNALFDVISGTN